jgi:hypothetical protein
VLFAVKAFLGEYYSDNSIGGVYFEEVLAVEVVVYKEGGLSEYIIECLKCLDILVIKGELVVCLYKLSERYSDPAIILYKPLVEVIEAKEGLDPFYYIRVVLVFNHLNLV